MKTSALSMHRSGSGEPLVLLHGWGMNASVFEPLRAELTKTRQVVNVDLPGYGASDWDSGLSFDDQIDMMLSELPAGELLGWSMGGLYAARLAQLNASKFNKLTLVCCNPCFVVRDDWRSAIEASVFDEFGNNLSRGWRPTVKRFLSLQMQGNDNARPLIRDTMERLVQVGEPKPGVLAFGLELLKQTDFRPLLSELDIPVKMILGARDVLVPESLAKEISLVNPGIAVESLATAAHAPFLSHTREFLAVL